MAATEENTGKIKQAEMSFLEHLEVLKIGRAHV